MTASFEIFLNQIQEVTTDRRFKIGSNVALCVVAVAISVASIACVIIGSVCLAGVFFSALPLSLEGCLALVYCSYVLGPLLIAGCQLALCSTVYAFEQIPYTHQLINK